MIVVGAAAAAVNIAACNSELTAGSFPSLYQVTWQVSRFLHQHHAY